ncbi:hypothetical protein N7445_003153 [Penicillium cf. griseofulvum]|nr:hypothetical protein N7445_003153 [Penicillium cf. griseofulvum]
MYSLFDNPIPATQKISSNSKNRHIKVWVCLPKTNIPRGTRVISENALLEVDIENVTLKSIVSAFELLPPPQQKSYLELHGYAGELFKSIVEREIGKSWRDIPELHCKLLVIYVANAFCSVFFLGSRINHSCIPNVNFAYNPLLKEETFHVIRDIMAGEELTVMYDGTNCTGSQRQKERSRWDSSAPARHKEEKRVALFTLSEELAANAADGTDESYTRQLKILHIMTLYKGLRAC